MHTHVYIRTYHEHKRCSVVVVGGSQISSRSPRSSAPDPEVELGVPHTPYNMSEVYTYCVHDAHAHVHITGTCS